MALPDESENNVLQQPRVPSAWDRQIDIGSAQNIDVVSTIPQYGPAPLSTDVAGQLVPTQLTPRKPTAYVPGADVLMGNPNNNDSHHRTAPDNPVTKP
jgi:hypothetical protein